MVRLGTQVVDEVRRRVQQDTVGHRGHKDDPLRKIRGLLRHGVEHLTDKQQAKIIACLDAGDPNGEVNLAWQRYQQVRSIYHAGAETGRTICQKLLDSFPSCPIPEVARLGRTLTAWRQQVLAYFDTTGVSNGGTEAINLIIEKVRRLAHGFRDFEHYRLRILLAAPGQRRYRRTPEPRLIPKRFPNACQPVLYGLRVHRCGHGGRAVPPLLDDGSAFVEVNVVRPATFICDVRRAGAPR